MPCSASAERISRPPADRSLDRVIAEMLVEPRAPGGAHAVSRLQNGPRAGAAAHEPEMAAVRGGHQLEYARSP